MQKKNDNFLDKIAKKDYNNELEKVLEKKTFDENVKSILLSILYKIETAYADYKKVKQNVETKEEFVENIIKKAEEISKEVCTYKDKEYYQKQRKIDKVLTSKKWGIPIMLMFLALIFWITIVGANYPSQALFNLFGWLQEKILYGLNYINCPSWIVDLLVNGIYQTLTWVISVMLPPMAIFFPLFTFLEDLGYLPRIAFNMDGFFKKACCSGKQMITMCMGVTKWESF